MPEQEMQYVKYCQNCGAVTTVKDCRVKNNGVIRRIRACIKCNFRFSTIEVEEDMYRQPTKDIKLIYPKCIRMRAESGKEVIYKKEEEV